MLSIRTFPFSFLLVMSFFLGSCGDQEHEHPRQDDTHEHSNTAITSHTTEDSLAFVGAMETHLKTIRDKDFAALEATLPSRGNTMHLILPNGIKWNSVDSFLNMHQAWFQDTSWTFETDIQYTDNTDDYGIAIVEATLREPERNGKPYFHTMHVTYAMKKINDRWIVVKDHASTLEKSE